MQTASIKNAVFAVLKDPEDYRYRAQIMWGGSLMHNDVRWRYDAIRTKNSAN